MLIDTPLSAASHRKRSNPCCRSALLVRVICLVLLIQLIANFGLAVTIKSNTLVTKYVNGKQVQAQRLVLQCDSNTGSTPLTLSLNRQGASEPDTLRFDCPPPEIDYDVELMGYIPEAVYVTNTPVVFTAPGINYTSGEDIMNYVTQQLNDQLARSGIEIDPADAAAAPRMPFDEAHSRSSSRGRRSRVWSLDDVRGRSSAYTDNPFLRATIEANRKLTRRYHEVHGKPMPMSGGVIRRHEHTPSARYTYCGSGQRCLLQAGTTKPPAPPTFTPGTGDFNAPPPAQVDSSGLYSFSEIMHRELTQTIVRGVIFSFTGVGFGVGAILTTIIDTAFSLSGQSALGLLAKTLEVFIGRVQQFQYNVLGFMDASRAFNKQVVQDLRDISRTLRYLEQIDTHLQNQVDLLQNKTDRMIAEEQAFRTSVQNQFVNVSNAFSMIGQNNDNITRVILQLIEKGDYQFQLSSNAIMNMKRYIEGVHNQAEGINSEILERRMISLFYHETLKEINSFADRVGLTSPFMNDPGTPPLSFAQKQSLRNVDGAIVMASVELQGSYRVAASPGSSAKNAFGVGLKIDVICDPDYVANISISDPSPEFLWDSIGPETTAMPQCSGLLGTARPWNCQCIFRVSGKRVQYPSSNPSSSMLFPWYLPNSQIGRYFSQINELTSGALTGSTPIDLTTVYINTMTEMEEFLESAEICDPDSATNSREWINNKVRVLNQLTFQYADAILDSSMFSTGRKAMCNGYYRDVLSANPSPNATIASLVYTFLRQEFGSFLRTRAEAANTLIYGSAGEVKVESQPGSTYPSLYPAYKQAILEFASLAVDEYGQAKTLPVYRLKQRGIRYKLNMRYNGGSTVTHSAMNASSETNIPSADSLLGNISVISDTTLSTINKIGLLEQTMPWVGHSVHHTNNPAYFDAVEDGTDPTMPTLHTDFKLTDIVFNGPREGAMNYIYNEKKFFENQPIKENYDLGLQMIMNMSTWKMQATPGSRWDPVHAANTAAQKLRRIPPGTSFCEESYNVFEASLTTARPNNDMCDIREAFEVPVYWPIDTSEVTFIPRDGYVFEHVVEIPVSTITEIVTSKCPTSYNITYYLGTQVAVIVLRSDSEAVTVKYSVCKADGVTCLVSGTTIAMGPGTPFSRTLTGVDEFYFLQAWPSTDSAPTAFTKCFPDAGIMVYINSSLSNSGALPGNVLSQVKEVMAPTLESFFSGQVASLAVMHNLYELLLSTQSSTELRDRVLANLEAIRNITNGLRDSTYAENQRLYQSYLEAQAYYANISALIGSERDQVLDKILKVRELNDKINSSFPILEFLVELQDFYYNGSLNAYIQLYNDFVAFRDRTGADLSMLNPLSIARRIGNAIGDAIGGVFGKGFGSVFGWFFEIVQLIMTIVFIVLIVKFAPQWLAKCRRGGTDGAVSDPAAANAVALLNDRLGYMEVRAAQDHAEIELLRTAIAELQAVSYKGKG